MMKRAGAMVSAILFGVAAAGIAVTPSARAEVPESKDPIKVVMINYSGDNIVMYIYGKLIEKLGYTIEYVPADYLGQFAGLETGDLHIG